ncbi:MAG TPA: hypothetical protein VIO37_03425 [Candidatus Dormibacteraeota bacterium]
MRRWVDPYRRPPDRLQQLLLFVLQVRQQRVAEMVDRRTRFVPALRLVRVVLEADDVEPKVVGQLRHRHHLPGGRARSACRRAAKMTASLPEQRYLALRAARLA